MKNFEMAHSNNPEEIILATQKSLIKSMREVLSDVKKDVKNPGLTWEQLDYFLEGFLKKVPEIIIQEHTQ